MLPKESTVENTIYLIIHPLKRALAFIAVDRDGTVVPNKLPGVNLGSAALFCLATATGFASV